MLISGINFIDHDNIYNGRVFGESQSSVRAHIEDGVMTASIVIPDETFHIEVILIMQLLFLNKHLFF